MASDTSLIGSSFFMISNMQKKTKALLWNPDGCVGNSFVLCISSVIAGLSAFQPVMEMRIELMTSGAVRMNARLLELK
eukprot:4631337-Heterocapsa_arctica.AAC.1